MVLILLMLITVNYFYYQIQKKFYVHVVWNGTTWTYNFFVSLIVSERENQKLPRLLSKEFELWIYWNEQKVITIWQMNICIFSNETVMELTDCFGCLFLSCHICTVSCYSLVNWMSKNPDSKQLQYLKFKWLHQNSNP